MLEALRVLVDPATPDAPGAAELELFAIALRVRLRQPRRAMAVERLARRVPSSGTLAQLRPQSALSELSVREMYFRNSLPSRV